MFFAKTPVKSNKDLMFVRAIVVCNFSVEKLQKIGIVDHACFTGRTSCFSMASVLNFESLR